MRVVVTGAAGFIGSHVSECLLARGDRVLGIDALTPFYDPARKRRNCAELIAAGGFELRVRDLCEPDSRGLAAELAGADAVCHLAGTPGVRSADRAALDAGNVQATQALVAAAARSGVPRVVLTSSSSVYAPTRRRVAEDAALFPLSAYGRSKLRAEREAAGIAARTGVELVVLRLFTVYGPRQRPDMAFARFIAAARHGDPMPVYGDGGQRREFTYVGDAAEAVVLALDRGRPGRVYNVSSGRSVPLSRAFGVLAQALGTAPPLRFAPSDRREHRSLAADTTRAATDLGFTPAVTLERGIAAQAAAVGDGFAEPAEPAA